ncbi:hypothetical protein IQ07DRAFT_31895 [Pyrenochaeta sp. DS3sAY3a]|nr:hypothetical protein IQ07DRAFT_31895 [Pyrenochaeta sp. DS3sAY3a]
MTVYRTVDISDLDNLIHAVAASIESREEGNVDVSSNGGEIFIYTHNDESIALGKEYLRTRIKKLGTPTKIPTLLRLLKGVLSISPEHIASFIPIRSRTNVFEEARIVIGCGSHRQQVKLVPGNMIELSGDDEITIEISDHVVVYMFLHPKSPPTMSEESMT